ncbi:LysR family transcriptional regulator [Gammaproteobacteria bacterium AS21]
MSRILPAMQALRSFEAAARLRSISKAADELFVTQSAVSKQIKILENLLGVALFNRSANGISLTANGDIYLSTVVSALNELNNAAQSLQSKPNKQQLVLDVIPSLSNIWLIPKIHSFEQRYPHLKVDLMTGDGLPNFNQLQADAYIRCLLPTQVQHTHIELCKEKLLLVISPKLLAKLSIDNPMDLLNVNLIQQTTRPQMWTQFFNQHSSQVPAALPLGMGFQHFFMSIKAAEEGLGAALVPDFLAADSIEKGLLINPLQLQLSSGYGYYLFSPSYKTRLKKVLEFNQWLCSAFAKTELAAN